MSRFWKIGLSIFLASLILLVYVVPLPFHPPEDTRIILDHTLGVYIVPSCFDQMEATNNLSEMTWADVQERGYQPESACTENKLQSLNLTLWQKLQESTGARPSSWE